MSELFLTILNMSITGAFVIAAICLARLPLKKAPKIISYCLWAVAGFRLVFPFSIESVLSLIPFNAAPIPTDIATQYVPRIDSGIQIIDNTVSSVLPTSSLVYDSNLLLSLWTAIGTHIWLAGLVVMFGYGVISYFRLKQKMSSAIRMERNLYETDCIHSPFVLGILKPKIYIPLDISGQELEYIILHEQTHIKRRDHIVKLIAYFVLCLHWFNPLAWAAFLLMGVDMEMSCDERVLKETGGDMKKDYSLSLLSLSSNRRLIGGSPLAFSEGGLKERIKRVLNFKKPSRIIVAVSIVLVAVLSVGFALNRVSDNGTISHDLMYFDVNGFQLGGTIDDTTGLTPVEPLADNQYDYNFAEIRYSLDELSDVIHKMIVYVYDDGVYSAFIEKSGGVIPLNTIEQVTDFFGDGRNGWQDREQRLRYVEYAQIEGRLYATVRFVYAEDNRLVWVIAESNFSYPASPVLQPVNLSIIEAFSTGIIYQLENQTSNRYSYGESYSLFVHENDDWQPVNPLIEDWGFNDEGYYIEPQSTTDIITVDWQWLYGQLPPGDYKFQKQVLFIRVPSDFDTFIINAYFSIPYDIDSAAASQSPNTLLPQIMVDDIIYYLDGNSPLGVMIEPAVDAPKVLSVVPLSKIPEENGQANFGEVGAIYVNWDNGIAVFWDGKWSLFVTMEELLGEYGGPSRFSSWRPLQDLPSDYSLEQAVTDGVYVNIHGAEIYNQEVLDQFYSDLDGYAAFVRTMQYTIEGDAIITDYQYNEGVFTVTCDTTRDRFGSNEIFTLTYNYLVPFEHTLSDNPFTYYLSNEIPIFTTSADGQDVTPVEGLWQIPSPSVRLRLSD